MKKKIPNEYKFWRLLDQTLEPREAIMDGLENLDLMGRDRSQCVAWINAYEEWEKYVAANEPYKCGVERFGPGPIDINEIHVGGVVCYRWWNPSIIMHNRSLFSFEIPMWMGEAEGKV